MFRRLQLGYNCDYEHDSSSFPAAELNDFYSHLQLLVEILKLFFFFLIQLTYGIVTNLEAVASQESIELIF